MTREAISTTNAPQAVGPYSQAIVVGDLIFCAGQGAIDPATQDLRHLADRRRHQRAVDGVAAAVPSCVGVRLHESLVIVYYVFLFQESM